MDFKAFKKQLSRIERAYELLHKEGDGSEVEMDLLRAYAKKLYELTLEGSSIEAEPKPAKASPPDPVAPKVISEKPTVTPELVPEPKLETAKAEETTKKNTGKAKEEKNNTEFDELFESKEAVELSEKLSMAKVTNIERAMSINEKIFAINELFDGDKAAFKSCLTELESKGNFEDAKHFLVKNVVGQHEWMGEEKKKKAIVFVDLVRRRFS